MPGQHHAAQISKLDLTPSSSPSMHEGQALCGGRPADRPESLTRLVHTQFTLIRSSIIGCGSVLIPPDISSVDISAALAGLDLTVPALDVHKQHTSKGLEGPSICMPGRRTTNLSLRARLTWRAHSLKGAKILSWRTMIAFSKVSSARHTSWS